VGRKKQEMEYNPESMVSAGLKRKVYGFKDTLIKPKYFYICVGEAKNQKA
jgi:hypothetical protein